MSESTPKSDKKEKKDKKSHKKEKKSHKKEKKDKKEKKRSRDDKPGEAAGVSSLWACDLTVCCRHDARGGQEGQGGGAAPQGAARAAPLSPVAHRAAPGQRQGGAPPPLLPQPPPGGGHVIFSAREPRGREPISACAPAKTQFPGQKNTLHFSRPSSRGIGHRPPPARPKTQ